MSGGRDSFVVEGRTFTVPSPAIGVCPDSRLAVGFYAGGTRRVGQDFLTYSLEPGAVDLGLVRSGRAPLLAEHARCLDGLLGAVISAETDGHLLRSVVKFARGPELDRLFAMLAQGFALSISIGGTILHAERVGDAGNRVGGAYRIDKWRLEEISIVTFGRDEDAHLRRLGDDEDAAAMVAEMQADGAGEPRAAVRRALYLDRWNTWAKVAGPKLAVELDAPVDLLCDALGGRKGRA